MPRNLIRYQRSEELHFLTFSCYRRLPYLETQSACELFERSLEAMRRRYGFFVTAYVVMPEHVHLLVRAAKGAVVQGDSGFETVGVHPVETASLLAAALL